MPAVNNSARLLYLSHPPGPSTLVAGIVPEFLTRGLVGQRQKANSHAGLERKTWRAKPSPPGC